MIKKIQQGVSLFEVILAIGIFSLVLVVLISLTIKAISNANYSKNRSLAARYNQESLEWVRGQRDAGWEVFKTNLGITGGVNQTVVFCFDNLTFSNPGACSSTEIIPATILTRQATFVYSVGPPESIDLEIIVSWQGSVQGVTNTYQSKADTVFTNWKSD